MRTRKKVLASNWFIFLALLALSACTDEKGALDQAECEKMQVAASCYTWAKKLEKFDRAQAIKVHGQACDMDHTEGCVRIGDLHAGQDWKSAHSWYKKACDKNNPSACVKQAEALLHLQKQN